MEGNSLVLIPEVMYPLRETGASSPSGLPYCITGLVFRSGDGWGDNCPRFGFNLTGLCHLQKMQQKDNSSNYDFHYYKVCKK